MEMQRHQTLKPAAKTDNGGLILLSCLPVMVIAVVMLAVGGVGVAFLIPAVTCGAMIGTLTFVTVRDKPR